MDSDTTSDPKAQANQAAPIVPDALKSQFTEKQWKSLKTLEAMINPQKPPEAKVQTPPNPKPVQPMQKPTGITAALANPKLSKESRAVLEKLSKEKKAFQIDANQYGKAIAESIMLQSQATTSGKINFEDELRKRLDFKAGSYGLIYKGNLPLRIAPFVWQLDQGTRRNWAVFTFNNFYGHKDPHTLMFWKKFWKILVLTPFDTGSNMVDSFAKGYLVKFDEASQFQMPMNVADDEKAEKIRVDNKNFISAALTLWMDLQAYTKPKINMKLVMYLIIGAGIVIFAYWFLSTHHGFLSGIIGNIG